MCCTRCVVQFPPSLRYQLNSEPWNCYLRWHCCGDVWFSRNRMPVMGRLFETWITMWPPCEHLMSPLLDLTKPSSYTYLLPSLLTPCSRILLEKLTGFNPAKKFPAFYGTRMFITAFTSARHMSLSWASSTRSIPLHPTSWSPS